MNTVLESTKYLQLCINIIINEQLKEGLENLKYYFNLKL